MTTTTTTSTTTTSPTTPVPPLPAAVHDLLERAGTGLQVACRCDRVGERYRCAHLAALRAAAALVAARATPATRRSRPRSVWELLAGAAPDLREWAGFFADSGRRRLALESGVGGVTPREADDLVRQAQVFLALVRARLLGEPADPVPALTLLPARP